MSRRTQDRRLEGLNCVVTGASTGIGKAVVKDLVALGGTVILLCRNSEKGAFVKQEISQLHPAAMIHVIECDLASLDQVRAAVVQLRQLSPVVNLLVNNAGVLFSKRKRSVDGFEQTFAVNHLAPFLLTNLLIPNLMAGAPARVVNVSSDVILQPRDNFSALDSYSALIEAEYDTCVAYMQSKLAHTLATIELARRMHGMGVTANCLHPGTVATDICRDLPRSKRTLPGQPGVLDPAQGAEPCTWLCVAPEVARDTGQFFWRFQRVSLPSDMVTPDILQKNWRMSVSLSGLDSVPLWI